jgi:hypothetical protein
VEIAVISLVLLLLVGRFFTERLALLPRFLNAVDYFLVPLLLPVGAIFVFAAQHGRLAGRWVLVCTLCFLGAWAGSWYLNVDEVHWLGAGLFAFGLLVPITFYLLLTNLGFGQHFVRRIVHLLLAILIANLMVGTLDTVIGLSRGVAAITSDFVFGTFGVNQNQLAFFLACMLAYFTARWRYVGLRPAQTVLLGYTAVIFLLCAFQTLWVLLPLAAFMVLFVFGRLHRRLLAIVLSGIVLPVLALSAISFTRFAILSPLVEYAQRFDETGKGQLIRSVPNVLASRPWGYLFGVGPGTFNSRAFRNIAIVPYAATGATDVAAALIPPFYTSPLSARYIIPYFERGRYLLSGSNTDGPFTSYISIPVEVGLPGAAAIFAIYGLTLLRLVQSLRSSRDAKEKVLASWALFSLLMLLGLAAIDNYLETSRYTLLVWLIIALWTAHRRGSQTGRQPISAPENIRAA